MNWSSSSNVRYLANPPKTQLADLKIITMRLLNIEDMALELFPDPPDASIPDYAILSHRWGAEEITFEDMRDPTAEEVRRKLGWKKIKQSCRLATDVGFKYIWIDTCCIKKADKEELTNTL